MKLNPTLVKFWAIDYAQLKEIKNITQTTGRNELKIAVKVD